MELNVNIEEILGSETVWDSINEPNILPTIGFDHKISFTSPYNPMSLYDKLTKEKDERKSKK